MNDNTFVSLSEISRLSLEMVTSEWWEKALAQQVTSSPEFRQGAMWGAAMAIIYATAHSSKYHPTVISSKDSEIEG